jgi:hypothetical protein
MLFLNKGLKYDLHHKHKKWIQTLAIEADTAICQLPEKDHGYMKQLVANNIRKIKINTKPQKKNATQFTLNENILNGTQL